LCRLLSKKFNQKNAGKHVKHFQDTFILLSFDCNKQVIPIRDIEINDDSDSFTPFVAVEQLKQLFNLYYNGSEPYNRSKE